MQWQRTECVLHCTGRYMAYRLCLDVVSNAEAMERVQIEKHTRILPSVYPSIFWHCAV